MSFTWSFSRRAEDAARELPNLPLEDLLQLVHLYAERGSPKYDGNGGIKVRASLAALARNGWLHVEQNVGEIRIRLGKNAKELRSPEQRRSGSGQRGQPLGRCRRRVP